MAAQQPPRRSRLSKRGLRGSLADRWSAQRFRGPIRMRAGAIIAEVLRLRPVGKSAAAASADRNRSRLRAARRDRDRLPEPTTASRSDRVFSIPMPSSRTLRRRNAARSPVFSVWRRGRHCIGEALAEAQLRAVLPHGCSKQLALSPCMAGGRSGWSSGPTVLVPPIAAVSRLYAGLRGAADHRCAAGGTSSSAGACS